MIKLIRSAQPQSTSSPPPTLVPTVTPPLTSLGCRADNATPMVASRGAYAVMPRQPPPIIPSPPDSLPSESPAADTPGGHSYHGGAHPGRYNSPHHGGAPPDDSAYPGTATGSNVRFNNDTTHSGGAHAYHTQPPQERAPHPSPTRSRPQPMSYDARSGRSNSSTEYHGGKYGLDVDIPLCKEFLYQIGFDDASVYSKIIRGHRIIRSGWHNVHYNSFGPQPETILKSNAFTTRLLLEKFDAPSIVRWYECLTNTCEGFRIALVPFNAIQFRRHQEGLCIPGLGFDRYDDMASALCTALPVCLTEADG
jgi:hypothetical protein